jgi:hypothetical protein
MPCHCGALARLREGTCGATMGNASPFSTTPTALHRTSIWHIDLAQSPIAAEAGGDVLTSWTIRLVEAPARGTCGTVITPGTPCRADALVALRAALLQHEPYGTVGGIPRHVRIGRSNDTITRTVVTGALSAVSVRGEPLPAATSGLGSPAERIAVALERTLLASTPHHARLLALRGNGDPGFTPSAMPFAQVETRSWRGPLAGIPPARSRRLVAAPPCMPGRTAPRPSPALPGTCCGPSPSGPTWSPRSLSKV